MKIFEQIERIADIGKPIVDLQKEISVLEAGNLWNLLTTRYDIIETCHILANFAKDSDLKLVLSQVLKGFEQQIVQLELIVDKYGIPLPKKPPASFSSITAIEGITDEYIYIDVYSLNCRVIYSFMQQHLFRLPRPN